LIFSTLCGIFYNFIILPSPATIRSLIMTVVSILLPFKIDKSQVLFSIAIVMLILDPNLILNMSFQLSFLCTFAILSKHKSLNISALSLPVLSQFSLGGIFTNFFILPIFSFALYFGLVGCFLQNEFLLQIGNFFLFLIYKIAGYFAFSISILTSDFIKFLYFLGLSLTIVSRNFIYTYFPFFILVLTKISLYFW